ncbi:MAG: NAD(P)H-quinone oxidoreductase subunit K, partial [Cyanobacteria bacterium]|nr:NAD(P)H-quinone oxidoreductase subunit K [Cyanobacteriota bacterium]
NQMPEPKYCIAMGACAISGGPFKDGYNVLKGIDRYIPVDIHIPGCPPRPEAIFDAVIKLRKKVGNEALAERGNLLPTHRYLTIEHAMKAVEPIVTGAYLRAESQKAAFAAGAGLPLATPEPEALEATRVSSDA